MASVGVAQPHTLGVRESSTIGMDKLPEELNEMRIRDDKVNDA